MLGDKRYEVGKTWHPVLKPFGENTCVNCTCFTGGNVKCTGVDCPRPDCEEPKMVPGECCPTCDAGTEGSKEVEGKRPGCQFHGASFKDGDTFPSNRTGLRPTRQDQCVMCVCTKSRTTRKIIPLMFDLQIPGPATCQKELIFISHPYTYLVVFPVLQTAPRLMDLRRTAAAGILWSAPSGRCTVLFALAW
ncbi:hypothetical protein C0Q70_21468 [Pomacea canaliculata]|uniref:VWFC domain-containing protein n=1 Tax=Pomacea canaliculata TaxID=400727 RepID=A0A2T7NCL0_POMCA|nr:hypothetical protein C0Q70_21468 [Pomacea canaliculata]